LEVLRRITADRTDMVCLMIVGFVLLYKYVLCCMLLSLRHKKHLGFCQNIEIVTPFVDTFPFFLNDVHFLLNDAKSHDVGSSRFFSCL
jgi:hypothetical protein